MPILPAIPLNIALEEMRSKEFTHLYETDEQGSQIAAPFDNHPKMLGHIIHLLSD